MDAQRNSHYGALEKLSGLWSNDPKPGYPVGQQANDEMWQWIIAAASAGALGRSGLGLLRMMQTKSDYDPTPSSQSVGIRIPKAEEEKQAADPPPISERAMNWLRNSTSGMWDKSWFTGDGASDKWSVPALWAVGAPAAVGAGIAGWKGVDAIADWRRKRELEKELQQARDEYQQLLHETMSKHSADDDGIEAALDKLADEVMQTEKCAAWPDGWSPSDVAGKGVGMMGLYAVLAALTSGKLSYDYFRERNQQTIAEEAMRRRSKERAGGMAPVYMQPEYEGG